MIWLNNDMVDDNETVNTEDGDDDNNHNHDDSWLESFDKLNFQPV